MAGTITSLGVGSGIDLNSMLTKLMEVEKQPLTALETRISTMDSKISAIGTLKSSISSLQDAAQSLYPLSGFNSYKITNPSGSTAVSMSASTGAVTGNYSISVSSLAKEQRLSLSANNLTKQSTFGSGTLNIETGSMSLGSYSSSSSFNVSVSSTDTMENIRDKINTAGKSAGVSAMIYSGTDGARLVLSSKNGTDGIMKLSGISGLEYDPTTSTGGFSQTAPGGQAASKAQFTVNGVAGTSATNTVTGFADGLTFTLNEETSSAVSLSVTSDSKDAMKTALDAMVKAYNTFASQAKEMGSYDIDTKKAGVLQGSGITSSALSSLRGAISGSSTSNVSFMTQIGLSFDKNGTLSLNEDKFNEAFAASANDTESFVREMGFQMNSKANAILAPKGTLATSVDGLESRKTMLNERADQMTKRLDTIQARYVQQFSSLDSLLSGLNSTSSYLTTQLNALSSNNK